MKTLQDYIKLAESATEGPWMVSPRSITADDLISLGNDPIDVARNWPDDEWLQWELIGPDSNVGRGDYVGRDCAFIAASRTLGPAMAKALIEAEEYITLAHRALLQDAPTEAKGYVEHALSQIQALNGGEDDKQR